MSDEARNLLLHVINCREAQRNYLKTRGQLALAAVKMAEQKLDALVEKMKEQQRDEG